MPSNDDKNSVCSDKEEDLEIKDKEEEEEDEDEEDEKEDDEEGEEEEEDDEDEDEEDDDDDEEYDPALIQYELLKNFFADSEGVNIATHLGSIAHELRRLNKVLLKK